MNIGSTHSHLLQNPQDLDRVAHFHVKDWTVTNVNTSETSELKR